MAASASEVRIAISGKIYTAPPATAAITNVATAIPVAWHDHGYTTPDGVKMTPKFDKYEVMAWQSLSPVRVNKLRSAYELNFILIQSGHSNTQLAFGGGTWAANAAEWKFTPPVPGVSDVRSLVIEVTDGAIVKRLYFPTVLVIDVKDIVFKANEETRLDVTIQVIGDSWLLFSNDPADDPAGAGGGGELPTSPDGGGGAIPSEPVVADGTPPAVAAEAQPAETPQAAANRQQLSRRAA